MCLDELYKGIMIHVHLISLFYRKGVSGGEALPYQAEHQYTL